MKQNIHYNNDNDLRYLNLLSQSFPSVAAASTEIINLEAILNLPKGTEHFLADLHGEYEAFDHVLRNASGNIKRKVKEIFGNTLREKEIRDLCTLIYHPTKIKSSFSQLNALYTRTSSKIAYSYDQSPVIRSRLSSRSMGEIPKYLPLQESILS